LRSLRSETARQRDTMNRCGDLNRSRIGGCERAIHSTAPNPAHQPKEIVMNFKVGKLPDVNPCDAFEHVRGRYIAEGFRRGVWTTLLVLLMAAAGIGYAFHHGSKELGTGPIGVVPPQDTTEAVPPLPDNAAPPLPTTPGLPTAAKKK
jgi:hypothetical protein